MAGADCYNIGGVLYTFQGDDMTKRLIQRRISLDEFQHESEGTHKWFKIKFKQYNFDNPEIVVQREYQRKYNVEWLLNAQTTYDPIIVVMEVVDDD